MKTFTITLTEVEKIALVRALDEAIDNRRRFVFASGRKSELLSSLRAALYKLDTAVESEAAT